MYAFVANYVGLLGPFDICAFTAMCFRLSGLFGMWDVCHLRERFWNTGYDMDESFLAPRRQIQEWRLV